VEKGKRTFEECQRKHIICGLPTPGINNILYFVMFIYKSFIIIYYSTQDNEIPISETHKPTSARTMSETHKPTSARTMSETLLFATNTQPKYQRHPLRQRPRQTLRLSIPATRASLFHLGCAVSHLEDKLPVSCMQY
jgi:hypothetical protein